MGRARTTALLTCVCACLCACGIEGLAPNVRFEMNPSLLCENGPPQNVTLDGTASRSADGESDGLSFEWTFSVEPVEVARGTLASDDLNVLLPTTRPVEVTLTVTDAGELSASRRRVLGLRRTTPTPCTHGCAAHETCVAVDGQDVCVDDVGSPCFEDTDCRPCLVCRADDSGFPRCLGPS